MWNIANERLVNMSSIWTYALGDSVSSRNRRPSKTWWNVVVQKEAIPNFDRTWARLWIQSVSKKIKISKLTLCAFWMKGRKKKTGSQKSNESCWWNETSRNALNPWTWRILEATYIFRKWRYIVVELITCNWKW